MMIFENRNDVCEQPTMPGNLELAMEARFILSAMDAAEPVAEERRRATRVRYQVEATICLAARQPGDSPSVVYTRDLTAHGLGLISPVPLPLGCGATLYLPAPGGGVDTIACHVIRCREMLLGWFDCAVTFKEETQYLLHRTTTS